MNIKILGSGCSRCESLEKRTRKAVEEMQLDATIIKVGDIEEILKYSVMCTLALVNNEKVIFCGKVPVMSELKNFLNDTSIPD